MRYRWTIELIGAPWEVTGYEVRVNGRFMGESSSFQDARKFARWCVIHLMRRRKRVFKHYARYLVRHRCKVCGRRRAPGVGYYCDICYRIKSLFYT